MKYSSTDLLCEKDSQIFALAT